MRPRPIPSRAGPARRGRSRRSSFAASSSPSARCWVYALALLPSVIFFGHGLDAKFRSERLTRRGLITPALMDSVQQGELADDVKKRLGKPSEERSASGEPARPAAHRECGDDDARDRAGGRSPLRPPERHAPLLQRGAGRQDLRVRDLRTGWPDESRAQPSRHWKRAVQPGSGAGEGGERQRRGRPDRQVVR